MNDPHADSTQTCATFRPAKEPMAGLTIASSGDVGVLGNVPFQCWFGGKRFGPLDDRRIDWRCIRAAAAETRQRRRRRRWRESRSGCTCRACGTCSPSGARGTCRPGLPSGACGARSRDVPASHATGRSPAPTDGRATAPTHGRTAASVATHRGPQRTPGTRLGPAHCARGASSQPFGAAGAAP